MTGKAVPATEPPVTESRSRRVEPASELAALAAGLDQFRDLLLQQLTTIESLAVEQSDLLDRDTSERERTLRERLTALEAAHSRLQSELKRREQEWQGVIRQVEEDRKLLTEAWERLEREQAEGQPPEIPARACASPGKRASSAAAPPAPTSEAIDDSITRAILWQFQALKDDVRRNAKGPGGH